MNGISTGTSNHDFFSQVGNGYLLGEVEAMQDDDYNYGLSCFQLSNSDKKYHDLFKQTMIFLFFVFFCFFIFE